MISNIGGAGGPSGPSGPIDGASVEPGADVAEVTDVATTDAAGATDEISQIAALLDAGRITPEQAMSRLVDSSVAGLPAAEQAELRQLMEDLLANDPYLVGLIGADAAGGR